MNLAQVNKVKSLQVLLGIANNSIKHQSLLYIQLNNKTVLFQRIQLSIICTPFKCQTVLFDPLIGSYQSQSWPGRKFNEGVFCIPQSSSITGASPSDCLMSTIGHSLWVEVLNVCRNAVSVFYSLSWLC